MSILIKPVGRNCCNPKINEVYYAQSLPRILGLVYESADCQLIIIIAAKIMYLLINSHLERIVKGTLV